MIGTSSFSINRIFSETANQQNAQTDTFQYVSEQFADLRILRYQVPGFDKLTLNTEKTYLLFK